MSDSIKISLAQESIAKLRSKILVGSTTNRNRLINYKHNDRLRSQVRIVDEVPNQIFTNLSIKNKSFTFKALPEEEKEPKDEKNQKFIDEYEIAQREDEVYLMQVKEMGENYNGSNKESLIIDRELKDRVRIKLKLGKRETIETIGIEEYAKKHNIDSNYELHNRENELLDKHTDRYIQTILKPKQLEQKLTGIKRMSRSALNEKGVNTLFLAIGFVEWVESENSDEKILSPLLLLPIEISEKKTKKGTEFSISGTDSDVQINIALKAKFEKDFGIILPDLEEEETPEQYFKKFGTKIATRDRWKIKRFLTLGHFYFAKMAMYYDLDPNNWNNLGEQQSLQDIFSGTGEGDSLVAEDYEIDEPEISKKIPLLINDADASQFSAIVDVMNEKNIAIQGPPGTGKSQTISNIIGAALANKKKILFCAEKKAALDVVYKKLQLAGIGDFCLKIDSTAQKKGKIIDTISKRLKLEKVKTKQELFESEVKKYEEIKNALIEYAKILTAKLAKSEKDIYELFGLTAKYNDYKDDRYNQIFSNLQYFNLSNQLDEISPSKLIIIIENLDKLESYSKTILKKFKNVSDHPWIGFINYKINPFEKENLVKKFEKLDKGIAKTIDFINQFKAKVSNLPIINKMNTLVALKSFATLKKLDCENFSYYLKFLKTEKDIKSIGEFLSEIEDIDDNIFLEKETIKLFHIKKTNFKKIKNIKDKIYNSHILSIFSSEFRSAKKDYLNLLKEKKPYSRGNAVKDLNEYLKYIKIYPSLSESKKKIENNSICLKLLQEKFNGINTNKDLLKNIIINGKLAFDTFDKESIKIILKDTSLLSLISENISNFKIELEKLNVLYESISENINSEAFFGNTFEKSEFENIKIKIKKLNLGYLDEWIDFSNLKSTFSKVEISFIEYFDKYKFIYKDLSNVFQSVYYNYLLKYAYDMYPELSKFNGDKLSALRNEYKEIDKSLSEKKKKKLYNLLLQNKIANGISHGATKKLTEKGLINRIVEQKRPAISLRQLIKRSSNALSDLMPCFIMPPTVLAELVRSQENLFDIVIIDEASQMRMEESIGALARSKQCVIVGDQQQLAPSDFFAIDYSDEEEDDLLEESILDLATSRFQPKRMLKWHYRSRHQSLIDFSNHNFYENQLIIPPSPIIKKPIFSHKIDSIYKGKVNNTEKDELILGLLKFMKDNIRKEGDKKSKSCLAVTMNIHQRDSILDDIERRKLDNPFIKEFMDSWVGTGEEFDVKNLENVQGDERDAIFISTLFGPQAPGVKPRQNFGAINNNQKGHRRLNVLFSRAKKEVHLYTSLNPNDIISEGAPLGCQIFKAYIEYAKTGKLEVGDTTHAKEPMSEFEVFVMNGLKRMGYDVTPQVGVSGFYIDLGIKHKSFPNGYLLGVECDGKTYHSSKSARDRDILRQSVLEDLGWNIYRIWSTDWFKDPQKELKKLDSHIKRLI